MTAAMTRQDIGAGALAGAFSAGLSKFVGGKLGTQSWAVENRYAMQMAVGGMAGAVAASITGENPITGFTFGAAVAAIAQKFNGDAHDNPVKNFFEQMWDNELARLERIGSGESLLPPDVEIYYCEIPINGYTRHALNQAISREGFGVSARAILDAVKNPTQIIERANGSIRYVGKNAVVVLNRSGEVITTWSKNIFGRRIQP